MTPSAPSTPPTVLITGCSAGGIGSSLAQAFQSHGLHVIATARTPSKMTHLSDLPNITFLALDVTEPASIAAAVKTQTAGRLNYLVNNAGMSYNRPILDVDVGAAKEMFDVNLWGVVACIQAFAPLLIEAKGTIVNISSILAYFGNPYNGVYCASKAGVSILGQVLAMELKPLGIAVVTVASGSVKTNLSANAGECVLHPGSPYQEIEFTVRDNALGETVPRKMDPTTFAEQVVNDILRPSLPATIWRGGSSTLVRFLVPLLPHFIVERILIPGTGLDVLAKKEVDRVGKREARYLD